MTVNPFDLGGRTALVTGARTGIGAAIADGLAQAGATVIRHGHHPGAEFEVDLGDPLAAAQAGAQLAASRTVDILVNNAGIIRRGSAIDTAYPQWAEVLRVNVDGPMALTLPLVKAMVARGSGKVINIASLLSFQGGLNVSAYTASKHAVAGFTKALANECAPHNVQVNAIAPGYIATANTEALRSDPVREPQIRSRIPAGRWGQPADLTGAAVFLASPGSDYVTGHILVVDGGWLAR